MPSAVRILGLDPGLRFTGWGVVTLDGTRLVHVADGRIATPDDRPLAERLALLAAALDRVLADWTPAEAAVEETFVNTNPVATLKLGMARGVVLLAPARAGLPVAEYGANHVKKSVVGAGHAAKAQVQAMVRHLLPGVAPSSADAADALAVAICHAHQRSAPGRPVGQAPPGPADSPTPPAAAQWAAAIAATGGPPRGPGGPGGSRPGGARRRIGR